MGAMTLGGTGFREIAKYIDPRSTTAIVSATAIHFQGPGAAARGDGAGFSVSADFVRAVATAAPDAPDVAKTLVRDGNTDAPVATPRYISKSASVSFTLPYRSAGFVARHLCTILLSPSGMVALLS